jgi:MoaA/NifB/PqqE/SkfB family radical SAM enzyme
MTSLHGLVTAVLPPRRDCQLNVYNIAQLRHEPADRFRFLRFDPNNTCNVHCVYCHNHRNADVVSTEDLEAFLDRNVISVWHFQLGCVMEPTLDPRLADLALLVGRHRTRPRKGFVLQTNGILLHMHDHGKLREAGLTCLSVSIDSSDPDIHRQLRGGTSIAKVGRNLAEFSRHCPGVGVAFITTVTRLNLPALPNLVRYGLDLGVTHFCFREVFYFPDNGVVDHARMRDLVLRPGEFQEMAKALRATFGRRVKLDFADSGRLSDSERRMRRDSRRDGETVQPEQL